MSPLHQQIRSDIERAILSGAWPPGCRIPFEHELMAQYGCARMTVSKALAPLVAAGLIERRKRAGSFVARPRLHAMVLEIPDIEHDVLAKGDAYAFRLLRRRRRRARADAAERELAGTGELLAIEGLHIVNGRPFGLEQRLIALAAAPDAAAVDFAAVSPGAWLLQHVGWTQAENRISALAADAAVAEALEVVPGTACLAVDRRTWRGAEPVTSVRQLFPGDAYDLVARFGPNPR